MAKVLYDNTVRGVFIKKRNRFTADVLVDDTPVIVHISNTGRLSNVLVSGAPVTLQKTHKAERSTKYDLISSYNESFGWINVDSLAPNRLMRQHFEQIYDHVIPEFTYGDSRIDFYSERGDEKFLREIKGCTLAYDFASGVGYFPDAPTVRGVKHLRELSKASREGYNCSIDFVIQMNGIGLVLPNDEVMPEFRVALEEAVQEGVHVICHSCLVEAASIMLIDETDDSERYM